MNPFGFALTAPSAPRRGPQDMPSAPFGFQPPPSKMQQTLAILNEYNPLPAFGRLLNSPMALGGPITEGDIADGLTVAGGVTGGSALAPKPKNALNMGIRAYHGSPHDFDAFSMSKIGTGEGNQAYGHGLYFADSEGVARSYRDSLAPAPNAAQEAAQRALNEFGGDTEAAANHIAKFIEDNGSGMFPETVDHYRSVEAMLRGNSVSPGRMYEVNIDADPDTFLDWDKPLSEQPEAVRGFADSLKERSFLARKRLDDASATGKDVWEKARNAYGIGNVDAAREALNKAGIPGIKYLDAGSRGAGDGTRNYVVTDDKLISIVRKYGIAGASALLGYDILGALDEAQAAELKQIEGNQ
jgi:hypothetical protein